MLNADLTQTKENFSILPAIEKSSISVGLIPEVDRCIAFKQMVPTTLLVRVKTAKQFIATQGVSTTGDNESYQRYSYGKQEGSRNRFHWPVFSVILVIEAETLRTHPPLKPGLQ